MSPAADGFELDTDNSVVGKLRNLAGDYSVLDAGGRKLDIRELSTKRIGKTRFWTIQGGNAIKDERYGSSSFKIQRLVRRSTSDDE